MSNLRKIMGFYNINATSLAKETGLSRSTINNAMGEGDITKSTMEKVAKAVGNDLTVNDIFFAQDVKLVVHN